MQAIGQKPHDSAPEPEAQNTDTTSSITVSHSSPINWKQAAFNQPRPRDPSWLSEYDITLPEEEKTSSYLPPNSSIRDFTIETSKPVTIPDNLRRYEVNIDKMTTHYKEGNYKEAQKIAQTLSGILSRQAGANSLIPYVDTVFFFCHIMQDMQSCLHFPADNSEDFINWLLDIAYAASDNTGTLPANSKLMLYCLRWAADAGSQRARQLLIKALLFSHSCSDIPSTVHFYPFEASLHLLQMSRIDKQPLPMDIHEFVIHKMVKLLKSYGTPDYDHEKNELAAFLSEQSADEIKHLAPSIYLERVFGDIEKDKARIHLEKLALSPNKKERDPLIETIKRYWELKSIDTSSNQDNSRELCQLAEANFIQATLDITKQCRHNPKPIQHKFIAALIIDYKPFYSEYPTLQFSLWKYYDEAIKPKGDQTNIKSIKKNLLEMRKKADLLTSELHIQAHDRIRSYFIHPSFSERSQLDNLRQSGRNTANPLPVKTILTLKSSRFSKDPLILTYIHSAQVLEHGRGNETLINLVRQGDTLTIDTLMLGLLDVPAGMDTTALVDHLLREHNKGKDFINLLSSLNDITTPLKRFRACEPYVQQTEQCCLLNIELTTALGFNQSENVKSYQHLAKEKKLQNKPDEAQKYYDKAWDFTEKIIKRDKISQREKVEKDYQVRRTGLPDYYQKLRSINPESDHPMETEYRYNLLLSVYDQMLDNKDPSLWAAWTRQASHFLTYSFWHIKPEMYRHFIDICLTAIPQHQHLLLSTMHNTINQLIKLTNDIEDKFTSDTAPWTAIKSCLLKTRGMIAKLGPIKENESIDEMEKITSFPSIHQGYLEQHHIITLLEGEKSTDDWIALIKTLTLNDEFDPATFVRLVANRFKSLPVERSTGIFDILSLFQKKIDQQASSIGKIEFTLKCQLMWAQSTYLNNLSEHDATELGKYLIEHMEKMKTELFIEDPEQVLINRVGVTGEEANLFFWANKTRAPIPKIDFHYFINNIKSFAPRNLLKLFYKNNITIRDACISNLRKIKNKEITHFVNFFIYQLGNNKDKILSLLDETLSNKTIDNEDKCILIWYAYESSLISDDHCIQFTKSLDPDSPHALFTGILVEFEKHAEQLSNLASSDKFMCLGMQYQNAVGFKLLSLGRLKDAAHIWATCESAYPQAMLAWHHEIYADSKKPLEVTRLLLKAAKEGQPKAQCELIRLLLIKRKAWGEIDALLAYRSCRFVHMPNPLAGGESVLYQGITQYLGFGCQADPATGEDKIRKALAQDPLIVALRLYELKDEKIFELPNDTSDYLLLYAQALTERCEDSFKRRDNYFTNLLLSYGIEKLERVSKTLQNRAEDTPDTQAVFNQAASLLRHRIEQWQPSALPLAPLQEEANVADDLLKTIDCVIDRTHSHDWATCAYEEMNNLIRKLHEEKTDLDDNTTDALMVLLFSIPSLQQDLVATINTIIDHINNPELITEIIHNWITVFSLTQDHQQKVILANSIIRTLPKGKPLDLENHKQEIQSFLCFLINDRAIHEQAKHLLDAIPIDEKANLLTRALPGGINRNPAIYLEYLEEYQSPSFDLIFHIWDSLEPDSEPKLIRATYKALTTQKPSLLANDGLNNTQLQKIDLYTLFGELSIPARKSLLENTFTLPKRFIEQVIKFHKDNRALSIPPQHLEKNVRDFIKGEKHFSMSSIIDILIILEVNQIAPDLLQAFNDKIKEQALERIKEPIETREQQNTRLQIRVILSIL